MKRPLSLSLSLPSLLSLLLLLPPSLCDLVTFDHDVGIENCQSATSSSSSLHFTAGMYTVPQSPAAGFMRSESYIDVDIHSASMGDIVIYHSSLKSAVGYHDASGVYLCCTEALLKKIRKDNATKDSGCSEETLGHLIIQEGHGHKKLKSSHNEAFLKMEEIVESGIYYIEITNCNCSDASHSSYLSIQGTVKWVNPYGYLSGDLYPYLPFFAVMAFNYVLVGVVWAFLTLVYLEDILPLQHCIGLITLIGAAECSMWYFDFWSENKYGQYLLIPTVLGILIDTFKRTVSRLLVLSVSMGFGVVKPTLGTDGYKVMFMGVLYFIFSGTFQLLEQLEKRVHFHTSSGDNSIESIESFFIFPVALFDTIFYWWIGVSLVTTIGQLRTRKQKAKLEMYQKLFMGLVVSALVSAFMVFYQLWVIGFDSAEDRWNGSWIWGGFWNIMYFVLLVLVAVLWRPQENNVRYSVANKSEDFLEEEDDLMEMGAIPAVADKMQKRTRDSPRGSSSASAPSSSVTVSRFTESTNWEDEIVDVEMMEMPIPPFTIDSDEEDEVEKME